MSLESIRDCVRFDKIQGNVHVEEEGVSREETAELILERCPAISIKGGLRTTSVI